MLFNQIPACRRLETETEARYNASIDLEDFF